MRRFAFAALCAALITMVATGCASKPLHGTTWAMVEYREKPFEREDDRSFTMIFGEDGALSGVAGCNSFMSEATLNEKEGTIRIVNKALTRAMCHNDVEEQNFLRMLQAARHYQINGSKLSLSDSSNNAIAVFKAQ